jgi:competence ComEA-like helix-hairpin-helix protein
MKQYNIKHLRRSVMKRVTILMGILLIAALSFGIASCEKKQGAAGTTPDTRSGGQAGSEAGPTTGAAQGPKVDINTASAQALQSVHGIDAALAQNIVSYRDANGPFSSVDDLSKVQGMDSQKLDQVRSQLTVSQSGQGGTSGGTGSPEPKTGSGETGGTDTSGSGGTNGSGSGGMNSGPGSTGY